MVSMTKQSIAAAREAKSAALVAFQKAAPRTRKAAREALEMADIDLDIAIRNYEQTVRAANPTMSQAEVMQIVRAA